MTYVVKGRLYCHKSDDMLFVKHQEKAKKTVRLLSSVHCLHDVNQGSVNRELQVILLYKQNKVRVDCFDQIWSIFIQRDVFPLDGY